MKPEFIYFDLDNTLLDHTSAENEAQKVTYRQYTELQMVPIAEWLHTYAEINHALWQQYQMDDIDREELQLARFRDSMLKLGLDPSQSSEIGAAYMGHYRNYWNWIDGARQAIEEVSGRIGTGIITNGFRETQQKKYEVLELNRYCSQFLISEDVGKMKPHPEVFDQATEMAGVKRENILYVGDSYSSDIVGGRNAGWKTAWYTAFSTPTPDRESADFRFSSFDQLLTWLRI
jgi:YjjG family noncanonical pyrimidine nucleotidase